MTPADKGLKKNATTAKREAVELVPGATLSLDMRQGLIKRSTRFKVSAQFKMGEPPETVEALRDLVDGAGEKPTTGVVKWRNTPNVR